MLGDEILLVLLCDFFVCKSRSARSALGALCSPGGSKGQLYIGLKAQSSHTICVALCRELGFSSSSCLKMGNVSGFGICTYILL